MLDTDTCIALIKRQPERLRRKLSGKSPGQVGVSSITLAELQLGVARSSRSAEAASALSEFLFAFEVAPFDEAACAEFGPTMAALLRKGTPIGPFDALIAAHALSLGATLVTHNRREFARVPSLRLEDWLA
jgi:tRNA(fMet)-specific endonuclease VapC